MSMQNSLTALHMYIKQEQTFLLLSFSWNLITK